MKRAILVVSFGTSYAVAEENCIQPVERAIAKAFEGWETRHAFTSRKIIQKLRGRGMEIDNETEALEKLRSEGYEQIIIAPTHLLHGVEYERVMRAADGAPISEALLETEADIEWMAGLLDGMAASDGNPILAMGHGTEHAADETYARLRKKLSPRVRLACVEGTHSLEALLMELDARPEREWTLMPLMLVAGDHAHNDMAGEKPDSWKSILEARGFDLNIRMQGLGALEAVQQRFVEKVKKLL